MDGLLSLIALLIELAFYVCVMVVHALVAIFQLIVYLFERCLGQPSSRRSVPPSTAPAPSPRPSNSHDAGERP